MIHPVNNDTGRAAYCGPRSIAALTGLPVSAIEARIRRGRRGGYRDRKGREIPIRGTHPWEVRRVLERFGCKVEKLTVVEPTLGRFIEDTRHVSDPILVEVTGHICVTHGGTCSDWNVRRKQRVVQAWRVMLPATIKYTPPKVRESKPKVVVDLKAVRYARVLTAIKVWETKAKRAKTALRKLTAKRKYYETKLGANDAV
jgi:hypothetical protein